MMYLNHSKAELKKFPKTKLVTIGHGILKKLPKTTLVNTVFKLEQLAKSKGIKSIGKIAKKVKSKVKKARKKYIRAKSAKANGRYQSVIPGKRIGRQYKKNTNTKKYRSGKKLYFTKTGQPYIKLASGKARFVKKR